MKFIMLSLEGLFSYKVKSSISLDKPGLTLVEGEVDNDADLSNGAGKTSIIDAICLCLFKCTTRGTDNDDVVNDDMDNGWASLTFLSGEEAYQAQYERDKKMRKTIWRIYQIVNGNLINISGKTQSETSQVIQAITGVDYKSFSNSVLFGQGSVSLFLSKEATDADRKRLFTQILDLDLLDEALAETRDSIRVLGISKSEADKAIASHLEVISKEKDFKMEKGVIEAQISNINKQILEVNASIEAHKKVASLIQDKTRFDEKVASISRTISELQVRKNAARKSYENRLIEFQKDVATAKERIEFIDKKKAELEEISKELEEVKALSAALEQFTKDKSEIDQQIVVLKSEIAQIEKSSKTLKEMKDQLSNCTCKDICPYCAQGLDEKSKRNVFIKIDMEHVDNDLQIDDRKHEIEKLEVALGNLILAFEPTKAILDKERPLSDKKVQLTTLVDSKQSWLEKVASIALSIERETKEYEEQSAYIKSKKDELQIELNEANSKLEEINKTLEGSYVPEWSQSRLEIDLTKLQSEKDKQNIALGAKIQALDNIQKAKSDVALVRTQLSYIEEELKYEKFLEEMFGPDGIKSLIIMSVTPRLTDLANKYLAATSDESITIEFVTSYEGKTTTIEDFKILVTRGLRTSDIRSFSGGEKKCIEFAVRFAISDIIREKSGCNVDSLFLDEPFDSLDENRIEKSMSLLRSLNEKFPTIFAMCHIPYAKDQFDRVITVRKVGNSSRIIDD